MWNKLNIKYISRDKFKIYLNLWCCSVNKLLNRSKPYPNFLQSTTTIPGVIGTISMYVNSMMWSGRHYSTSSSTTFTVTTTNICYYCIQGSPKNPLSNWQTCSGSRLWCKEPIPFVLPTTSQSTLRTLSFSVFEHTVHCTTQPTFSWNGTRVSWQWRPKIISEQNFGHYWSMPTF